MCNVILDQDQGTSPSASVLAVQNENNDEAAVLGINFYSSYQRYLTSAKVCLACCRVIQQKCFKHGILSFL